MSESAPHNTLHLRPGMFGEAERPLLETSEIRVTSFRYSTGVEALRLTAPRTELVVLPFRGQQIWRYSVDGEDMTMRTHFEEPAASTAFGETYGAFLLHCGLTGIGHPGPADNHALHGELPNATYPEAQISVSRVDGHDEVWVTGAYRVRTSHTADVVFRPRVTVRSEGTGVEVRVSIGNRRASPFDFCYLCHVNWSFPDGGRLAQSVALDPAHFELAPHPNQDALTAQYIAAIERDPVTGARLDLAQPIVPEYCAILRPQPDAEGWAHFLMVRPDGRAASVSFETAELPYAIRWISNTGDEQAAGFCLPSTAHHRGRAAAEADGMVRTIPGHSEVSMRIAIDLLDQSATVDRLAQIEAALVVDTGR